MFAGGGVAFSLPTGSCRFTNNRTQLGVNVGSLSAQLIASCDDLGVDHNHSVVLFEATPAMLTNTVLWAPTVRANGNRFQEPNR